MQEISFVTEKVSNSITLETFCINRGRYQHLCEPASTNIKRCCVTQRAWVPKIRCTFWLRVLVLEFMKSETIYDMVVYHTNGLHECVTNCRSDEFKPSFLQILAHGFRL